MLIFYLLFLYPSQIFNLISAPTSVVYNLNNSTFSEIFRTIKKFPNPSNQIVILLDQNHSSYEIPSEYSFISTDFKSIYFCKMTNISQKIKFIVHNKASIEFFGIEVIFEGISFQPFRTSAFAKIKHTELLQNNFFYFENCSVIIKNCQISEFELSLTSIFFHLLASNLLLSQTLIEKNIMTYSSNLFIIEANYRSFDLVTYINNVSCQSNYLSFNSKLFYFVSYSYKPLKILIFKVKIVGNTIFSDSSLITIDIYINRLTFIFKDSLFLLNKANINADGLFVIEDNSLMEANLGNFEKNHVKCFCSIIFAGLHFANNYNENRLFRLNGARQITSLQIIYCYFDSNNVNSGVLFYIENFQIIKIINNYFKNTIKTGVTTLITQTNYLILSRNCFVNLFNNNELFLKDIKKGLFIDDLVAINEPSFQSNLTQFIKKPRNSILRIGGLVNMIQCYNITLNKIFLDGLILVNTPAIMILECDHMSHCQDIHEIIIIIGLIAINNALINNPDSTSCLSISQYTSNSNYFIDNALFMNNSLTSEPTYSFSSAGIVFQGLMSRVFMRSPIFEGNSANHQAAGLRIFAEQIMIYKGSFINNSNYNYGINFINSLQGITFVSCKRLFIKMNEFDENISGETGALYILNSINITVYIDNCIFTNNFGTTGGAISFSLKNLVFGVLIQNSHFEGNLANENGGAISFGKDSWFYNIVITKNIFIKNTVNNGNGGAIYYGMITSDFESKIHIKNIANLKCLIKECYFKENQAELGGNLYFEGFNFDHSGTQIMLEENFFLYEYDTNSFVGYSYQGQIYYNNDVNDKLNNENFNYLVIIIFNNYFQGIEKDIDDLDFILNYNIYDASDLDDDRNRDSMFRYGTIISVNHAEILFENNYFNDVWIYGNDALIHLYDVWGSIKSLSILKVKTVFLNVTSYAIIIHNSSIYSINIEKITISFDNNSRIGGILLKNNILIKINYGLFYNNKALNGASIHVNNNFQTRIIRCKFINNEASIIGGAIFFNQTSKFEVEDSIFIANDAYLGSDISFSFTSKKLLEDNGTVSITRNTFLVNKQKLNESYNNSVPMRNNMFYMDFGDYHQYYCKPPIYNIFQDLQIIDFNLSCQNTQYSRDTSFPFNLIMTHNYDLKHKKYHNFTIYLTTIGFPHFVLLSNNTLETINNLHNLLYYDPHASPSPLLKSPFNLSTNSGVLLKDSSSILILRMSQCLLGEVFREDLQACKKCDPGTVSLESNTTICKGCPNGASCYNGGFNISIDKDYWRGSLFTYQVYSCDISLESCLGGLYSTCLKGYRGPKCGACDNSESYMLGFERGCKKCGDNSQNILFFVLINVGVCLFEAYYIYTSYLMNKLYSVDELKDSFSKDYMEEKKRTCMYFRVLTLYLQVLAIIQGINLRLPVLIQKIFITMGIPNNTILYSNGCFLFYMTNNYIYLELILSNLMLLGKLFFILIVWLLIKIFNPLKVNRRMLIVAVISLIYLEQPGIIANLFSMLGCEYIDNSYYLVKDYNFKCYDEHYQYFIYILIIPGMIIWGVIFPLGVLYALFQSRHHLNDKKTKTMLGFFYCPYKRDYFYWEIVQIIFKMVLILLSYIILYDIKTKAMSLILVIAIYWALSHLLKPFNEVEFKYFNQILEGSNLFFILLIFFSLFSKDNYYNNLELIADVIVIGLNIVFGIIMIIMLYFIFKNRLKRMFRWVKNKYHTYKTNQKRKTCSQFFKDFCKKKKKK